MIAFFVTRNGYVVSNQIKKIFKNHPNRKKANFSNLYSILPHPTLSFYFIQIRWHLQSLSGIFFSSDKSSLSGIFKFTTPTTNATLPSDNVRGGVYCRQKHKRQPLILYLLYETAFCAQELAHVLAGELLNWFFPKTMDSNKLFLFFILL